MRGVGIRDDGVIRLAEFPAICLFGNRDERGVVANALKANVLKGNRVRAGSNARAIVGIFEGNDRDHRRR